jgi:transcriptional regulator with XRE-family HTH domain
MEKVIETLEFQGRTRQWLAERMEVSPAYVTLLLKGQRRWTSQMRERAATALDVPVKVLFGVEEGDDGSGCEDDAATPTLSD